jgi:hypothetical protein
VPYPRFEGEPSILLDAEGENSRQLPPPTVLVFTGGESMVVMGSGLGAYGQTAGGRHPESSGGDPFELVFGPVLNEHEQKKKRK